MNYGRDDIEILKEIKEKSTSPKHIDYLDKIIEDWEGYLSLTDMIDHRISKIEFHSQEYLMELSKLREKNKILNHINNDLIDILKGLVK